MSVITEMQATIDEMAVAGKGILAADESDKTIKKRFDTISLESTETTRRDYRAMLFTTPKVAQFINGVILFEETLKQSDTNGKTLPDLLAEQGIVPGIKVDKGLIDLANTHNEKITQGLDGLPERLAEYKKLGARFAKWRAVYTITDTLPSQLAIMTNAENLARYAAICQTQGIVPIVEPEVLIDGTHTIERCAYVTERVQNAVFTALRRHHVSLEHIILKPSMVVAGKTCKQQASVEEVARATVEVLRRTVPAAVPTINFLSGGQTPEQATTHLNAMNQLGPNPWVLSYSYGRALQEPCLKAWQGKVENVPTTQQALFKRAKLNSAASLGQYTDAMEQEAVAV